MTVLCVAPVDWWSEGLLPFLPQPDDKKVDAFQQRHTQLHHHGAKGQAVTMTTPHLCVLWSIWTPDLAHQWIELTVYPKQLLRNNAKRVNGSAHKQRFAYSSIILKRRVELTHYKPHIVVLCCFIQKLKFCNHLLAVSLWNAKGDT